MKILLLISVLFISGCGGCMGMEVHWSGHARTCIDGVVYYQFASGAAVAYDKDGKVKIC